MGKIKNKGKRQERRVKPLGPLPSVSEAAMQDEQSNIPAIITQLKSDDWMEREYACANVSNIVLTEEKDQMLQLLWNSGGLKQLFLNLCDPSAVSLRVAAAGAIRNVSIAGGPDACETLVKMDSLTPLVAVLQQTHSFLVSENKDSKAAEEIKEYEALLLHVVATLSFLIENSEKAIDIITKNKDILQYFFHLLQTNKFTQELAIQSGELLQVLTDENPPIASQVRNSQAYVQVLDKIFGDNAQDLYLRALCASILYNVRAQHNDMALLQKLYPFLLSSLEFDGVASLSPLHPDLLKLGENTTAAELEHTEPSLPTNLKAPVETWKHALKSQHLALEILTNICTVEEGEEMDDSNPTLPPEILKGFAAAGIAAKALKKCAPLPPNVIQELLKFKPFVDPSLFITTQIRALSLLSNILLYSNGTDIGEVAAVWELLCQLCSTPLTSPELLESTTGVMFLLLKKQPTFTPSSAHVEGIINLLKAATSEELKINTLGMLGIIGQQVPHASVAPELGVLFMNSLLDSSYFVASEALNSIFDVFAETQFNEIVKQQDMLNKLVKCLHMIRQKLKSKAEIDEEIVLILEEAEENLTRFLEYKYAQFK